MRLHGEPVQLTRTERELLEAMARRLGELCPHRYLLTSVWGDEYLDDTHYLRGYIASLRTKLEDDPAQPRLLLTEWGTGYRLASLPPEFEPRHADSPEVIAVMAMLGHSPEEASPSNSYDGSVA